MLSAHSNPVTIATACRNRLESLLKVLPSWLAIHPSKIIICDWGSTVPLTHEDLKLGEYSSLVEIVRIESDRWVLTWAFNEALSRVTTPFTLKLDCEHVVSHDFFEKNRPSPGGFLRGHWRNRQSGQEYINGAFFADSSLLAAVGYFDERITTYGWDDSNLYERLAEFADNYQILSPDTIIHLEQDNSSRTAEQDISVESAIASYLHVPKTEFLILRNRIFSGLHWPWDDQMFLRRSEYRVNTLSEAAETKSLLDYATLKAFEALVFAKGMNSTTSIVDTYHQIIHAATGDDSYQPSPVLLSTLLQLYSRALKSCDSLNANILRLCLLASSSSDLKPSREVSLSAIEHLARTRDASVSTPSSLQKYLIPKPRLQTIIQRPRIFVDVQHGLGNRLRALASAAVIAKATDRELVIVWEPDHHCQATLHDLFAYSGPVEASSFLTEAAASPARWDLYNYMTIEPGSEKNKPIDLATSKNLYLRSAFVFNTPATDWHLENIYLRTLRPVDFVLGLVAAVRHPNHVSAHVRMGNANPEADMSYENQENNWTQEDHEQILLWREKCHFSRFIDRIRTLLVEFPDASIMLASDSPEAYEAFQSTYGDRLSLLPRSVNDRSTRQIQYALADAILLSKATHFLGSNWSSFSELVVRLSGPDMTVEMSGVDF